MVTKNSIYYTRDITFWRRSIWLTATPRRHQPAAAYCGDKWSASRLMCVCLRGEPNSPWRSLLHRNSLIYVLREVFFFWVCCTLRGGYRSFRVCLICLMPSYLKPDIHTHIHTKRTKQKLQTKHTFSTASMQRRPIRTNIICGVYMLHSNIIWTSVIFVALYAAQIYALWEGGTSRARSRHLMCVCVWCLRVIFRRKVSACSAKPFKPESEDPWI